MSAIMKEHYVPEHPGHEEFMKLVKKGCPRCGDRLYQKGLWPIGEVYCDNYLECAHEFVYNGNGKWLDGPDGKPGQLNERYKFPTQTAEYKRTMKELKERRRYD